MSKLVEVAGEGFQDVVGGFGPDERLRVLVPGFDPGADVGFEFFDAAVGAAAQFAVGQLGEPAFDEVEPRGVGRGEVQVEPGVLGQPLLDLRGLVGGVVVTDQVQLQVFWGCWRRWS